MNTHFFSDTSVMLGRSLRHVTRSVDTIVTVTIMPIAFMLLFVYVFGGAIRAGTGNYVNYLMPGILLIAIASGISYTAFRLFNDLQSGIFERFHSMPIARSSVLWGHVLTSWWPMGSPWSSSCSSRSSWASARRRARWRGSPWRASSSCSPWR